MVLIQVKDRDHRAVLVFSTLSKEDRTNIRNRIEQRLKELVGMFPGALDDHTTARQTFLDFLDSFLSWCIWEYGEEPTILSEDELLEIRLDDDYYKKETK